MRTIPLALMLIALLLGCSKDDGRVTALEAQLASETRRVHAVESQMIARSAELAVLRQELEATRRERDALQQRLDQPMADEAAPLRAEIARLNARIIELESAKRESVPQVEPEVEPVVEAEPAMSEALLQQFEQLLPAVKSRGPGNELDQLTQVAMRGDKAFRDHVIARFQEWAGAEPENEKARLALAGVLTTRFIDLEGQFIRQGELAGKVNQEIDAALAIDPDYYDAVHFLAIMKANYPSFTNEFKTANVELDRALSMQQQLPWEPRFVAIYIAYSRWLRAQSRLDEASAKVEEGLRHAANQPELIAEKEALAAAKAAQGD